MGDKTDFGLPDAVLVTILSFAAHPDEPHFNILKNLSRPTYKSVEKFSRMFSPDPVLLVESETPYLAGTWYFSKLEFRGKFNAKVREYLHGVDRDDTTMVD